MRILLVDDDPQLAAITLFALRREGHSVQVARDGRAALDCWAVEHPDLLLLDLNLPALSGWEVLQEIRARDRTPVILLTVHAEEEDIVRGLDLGADDYIVKPYSPSTLLARIRAVGRRAAPLSTKTISSGSLRLDPERLEIQGIAPDPIRLTPLEFRLVEYLVLHRGQVLSAERLIEQVWGYDDTGDRILLKQLVRRVRRKIEPDPASPRWIQTIPNAGYTFAVDE